MSCECDREDCDLLVGKLDRFRAVFDWWKLLSLFDSSPLFLSSFVVLSDPPPCRLSADQQIHHRHHHQLPPEPPQAILAQDILAQELCRDTSCCDSLRLVARASAQLRNGMATRVAAHVVRQGMAFSWRSGEWHEWNCSCCSVANWSGRKERLICGVHEIVPPSAGECAQTVEPAQIGLDAPDEFSFSVWVCNTPTEGGGHAISKQLQNVAAPLRCTQDGGHDGSGRPTQRTQLATQVTRIK